MHCSSSSAALPLNYAFLSPGYGAPPQEYAQPQSPQGYAQPPQGYGQPPQGYGMQQQTQSTVVVQAQAAPAVTNVVVWVPPLTLEPSVDFSGTETESRLSEVRCTGLFLSLYTGINKKTISSTASFACSAHGGSLCGFVSASAASLWISVDIGHFLLKGWNFC